MRRYGEPVDPGRRYRDRPGAYAVIREGDDVLRHRAGRAAARSSSSRAAASTRARGRCGRCTASAWRRSAGASGCCGGSAPSSASPTCRSTTSGRARSATSISRGRCGGWASRRSPGTARSGCRSRRRSSSSPSTATGRSWRRSGAVAPAAAARRRAQQPLEHVEEPRPVGPGEGGRRLPGGTGRRRAGRPSGRGPRAPCRRSPAARAAPSGASARAPRSTQRAASGTSAVTQTGRPDPLGDPPVGGVRAPASTTSTRAADGGSGAARRWSRSTGAPWRSATRSTSSRTGQASAST